MGPGALMREKPWRTPANVTEELWYRGFIMESTEIISGEPAQVFVIPHELRPWIPVAAVPHIPSLPEANPPPGFVPSPWTLGADMTLLLAFVYLRRLRLRWDERWHARDRCDLAPVLGIEVVDQADEREGKFGFLWALAQEMGLLVVEPGSVVLLHREKILRWLDLKTEQAHELLWNTWVESKRWNDLCMIPEIECSGTGWENDPPGTRRRFLSSLLRWTSPSRWYSLSHLVEVFARNDPDFQRPNGDYRSWGVRSRTTGKLLLGRGHWYEVEGALIRFFVTGPMSWLGAMDVTESDGDVLFRWTDRGDALVSGEAVPAYPREPLRLEGTEVLVAWSAPPRTVFRAARIAEFVSRDDRGMRFRITAESLTRAYARGVSFDAAVSFLSEATGRPVDREKLISMLNGAQEHQ